MTEQAPQHDIEAALIVASLAHLTARTPKERRVAWERLLQLKAARDHQQPKNKV